MKTPDHAQSSAALGVLCTIAAATVFSTGGVIVRRIDLPAWDVSFWRSVLLVATILPLLVWQRRAVWIDVRNAGPALLASAVVLAGSMVAFILALGHAPVANVLIVFGATPFITALLALGPGQLAGGLLLYIASLKRIPAGRAALLGLLELVLGPIWVWAIDGEKPADLTLVGGVIVIGSAAANVWLDSRRATG